MGLAAPEKAGHSGEETTALLSARRRICLGNLFFECSDSILRVRESLLHDKGTLDQQVGSLRNLSNLAPNKLVSLGVLGLATRLAQSIEQTGYEITFFWCHKVKEDLVLQFDKSR